jgi:hypothetical protein
LSAGALLAVVLAFGLVAGLYELHDPDVWWVAAAGRARLEHGAIPATNLFSFTDPEHPWLMHEWLLAVPYAWVLEHLGPGGFALGAVLQTSAAIGILARYFRRETERAATFLALTAVTIVLFGLRFLTLRPTHVALLVALAFATVVYRGRLDARRTALLVLLELAWTNLHGSFVVGVCLILGSALVYRSEWRARSIATGLVTLATFANPYGAREHAFVLEYFLGRGDVYRVIHAHVEDFAPLYSLSPVEKPLTFVGFFAVVGALGVLARTREGRGRAAIVLVLALVAMKNARHLDLAGIVSMILVAPRLDELWRRGSATNDQPWGRSLPRALGGAALVAGALGFAARTVESPSSVRFVTPDGTPGAAWVPLLARVPDGARLYVPFSAGGVAIWYTAPRGVRVFYDPRNDCYSADVARDAFALEFGTADAELTLAKYDTTYALTPRSHPVARALRDSRRYRETPGVDGDLVAFRAAEKR